MSDAEPPKASTSGEKRPTLNDLIEIVVRNDLDADDKKSLIAELRKTSPTFHDRWLYRYVVWSLGLVAVLSVVGFVVMGTLDKTIPDGLVALGSAAIGGLAGLSTASRARPAEQRDQS